MSQKFENIKYLNGFGNLHQSEALEGAIPPINPCAKQCPYGLVQEQLNGSTFTAPKDSSYSWLFRTQVLYKSQDYKQCSLLNFQSRFDRSNGSIAYPAMQMWKPLPIPDSDDKVNFIQGVHAIGGLNDPSSEGYAIYSYAANSSMENTAFVNADGDFLIVPQEGTLQIQTEFGLLVVEPKEIVVIPQGVYFSVNLPENKARGFILEIFHNHFILPPLGVLGKNANANPIHFQAPVAYYEDNDVAHTIIRKLDAEFWTATLAFSPFNVVGWFGNYYPYKYDLRKFQAIGSITYGHVDPSSLTVLTAQTTRPGVAVCDFICFCPRWFAFEGLSIPYPHRNAATEFNAVLSGSGGIWEDGGFSLSPFLSPHGVGEEGFENARKKDAPFKLSEDNYWIMFESGLPFRQTSWSLNTQLLKKEYAEKVSNVVKHFNPKIK